MAPSAEVGGRHRHCRAQLDDTVVAREDLDLGARLIQMHPPAQLAGQCEECPGLQPDVAVKSHTISMIVLQRSRKTASLICRIASQASSASPETF